MVTSKSPSPCLPSRSAPLVVVLSLKRSPLCLTCLVSGDLTPPPLVRTPASCLASLPPLCWLVSSVCVLPWLRDTWSEPTWPTTAAPLPLDPRPLCRLLSVLPVDFLWPRNKRFGGELSQTRGGESSTSLSWRTKIHSLPSAVAKGKGRTDYFLVSPAFFSSLHLASWCPFSLSLLSSDNVPFEVYRDKRCDGSVCLRSLHVLHAGFCRPEGPFSMRVTCKTATSGYETTLLL